MFIIYQQAKLYGSSTTYCINPEIMVYISNTQLEMLNQYAKLLEEKHFYTWKKAKRTDTKIQIAWIFLQTLFWVKL